MTMMDYVIGGMDRTLQAETLLYALRGGTGRTATRHHQRVPRRLPSIDRHRPQGRNRPILPWRQFPRRLWPRACGRHRERQGQQPRAAMGLHRKALEMDRRARQGFWNRTSLSQSGSAPRGADRRPGICLSPRRRENAGGGSDAQEEHPGRRAGRSQQGEVGQNRASQSRAGQSRQNRTGQNRTGQDRQNRKVVEGQNHVAGSSSPSRPSPEATFTAPPLPSAADHPALPLDRAAENVSPYS